MLKSPQCLKFTALALLGLSAPVANADQLFTNFSGGVVAGNLWTAGGPCNASCFALEDNFSNPVAWDVSEIDFYVQAYAAPINSTSGWRYALFDAETGGNPIVAPTDAGAALSFTDTTIPGNNSTEIYKGVLSGLNISLPAGTYWFRITNTNSQGVYPAEASSPSAQTISPALGTLIGDSNTEALLSTNLNQTSDNWAFEVYGEAPIFRDGFEGP